MGTVLGFKRIQKSLPQNLLNLYTKGRLLFKLMEKGVLDFELEYTNEFPVAAMYMLAP